MKQRVELLRFTATPPLKIGDVVMADVIIRPPRWKFWQKPRHEKRKMVITLKSPDHIQIKGSLT